MPRASAACAVVSGPVVRGRRVVLTRRGPLMPSGQLRLDVGSASRGQYRPGRLCRKGVRGCRATEGPIGEDFAAKVEFPSAPMSGDDQLTIYGDDFHEARWFSRLDPRLRGASIELLVARGKNPAVIDPFVTFDRPDIVLVKGERPVLVFEKTKEVPTGHNVGQRLARLVRSIERGIPTIKFFPFDALKHGEYAGMCYMNARLLFAFKRMSAIHRAPMLAMSWPIDKKGELVEDGSEWSQLAQLLQSFMDAGMQQWWPGARDVVAHMESEYERRIGIRAAYADPPDSVAIVQTAAWLKTVGNPSELRPLNNRKESLVYTIKMTPEKCRREDPYTGTQFLYDYCWCRSGPAASDKERNLVLRFPLISRQVWEGKNPDYAERKSSNWYLTANALVFSDSAVLLRTSTP